MRTLAGENTAGGKGINVCRVLSTHGHKPQLITFISADSTEEIDQLFAKESYEYVGIPRVGRVRSAIILLENPSEEGVPERVTVINENGLPLQPEEWQAYKDAVRARLSPGEVLVCSGSVPVNAPADAYGQLTQVAHECGALAYIDAAPATLAACLPFGPDLVKPNLEEAEALFSGDTGFALVSEGRAEGVPERALSAAKQLQERGARNVVVTAGAAGAAWVTATGEQGWIDAPVLPKVVSAVGAGDSFLGGLCTRLSDGVQLEQVDWADTLRFAASVAGASCEVIKAGGGTRQRAEEIYDSLRA